MITNIIAAAVGNALKIFLAPPAGSITWILLRNDTGTFASQADGASIPIYDGNAKTYLVDTFNLTNGAEVYYSVWYFDGTNWTLGNIVSATAECSYMDQSTDVLSVVRDRLEVGLQNEILIGNLSPATEIIQVLNAPPVFDETNWPVVTVHVATDASGDRAVGEMFIPDVVDPISGDWMESQGWFARAQLTIVGWSKNPDERIALRKAMRKIVLGNLEVFDSFGMVNIDFSQQDADELSAYPAPVYQSLCTFSCEAPAIVSDSVSPFATTEPTITVTPVF